MRRHYFGWFDGVFRFSRYPADAPVRPCIILETIDEVRALLTRRGTSVYWWPPLPENIRAQIQDHAEE